MSYKEDPTVETNDNEIRELNPSALLACFPNSTFDFQKFAEDKEAEFQELRKQLPKGYNPTMRNEQNRLKSFLSYKSHASWSLTEMSAAGFYHTCVQSSVQCFCCGLVLFATKVRCTPYEQHKKFSSTCAFILGKEVGNISKYDIRVQKLAENPAEHSDRYSAEEARLQSFGGWPFYAKGTKPDSLARAGFFFTGKKDVVQCFACGGCLGNWEDGDDPWREHAKWFPECEFLQSKKSSEEIKKHIETYPGFVGVVGRHFTASFVKENLPTATGDVVLNIFEDEGVRLDSFKTWPAEAPVEATALAKAGFFYTGRDDIAQCFNCAGCLGKWEEGDDPMEGHAKWFPDSNCMEILGKSLEEQPESPSTSRSAQTACKGNIEEKANLPSVGADMTLSESQHLQEARNLTEQLKEAYNDKSFRKLFSFGNSNHLAIDLKILYGDLSLVSKDINDQPIQQLFLHDILVNLNSTTVLEGETGSGKTALLRKIALLWASGCCPILSRFKFVFYISLTYARSDQSMAEIICNQPVGFVGPLTETTLRDVIQPLKNQVLFLLDDYSEINSVPQVVEELIQRNHLYQHCLVVAARTNRTREIRKYASTTLSIAEFPLSSILYVLKKLFSYNIGLVEHLIFQMEIKKSMQTILKTPLFMVSLAAYWVQHPKGNLISDKAIFKAYLLYHLLKHNEEREHILAMFSSCGELAITGLFKSSFDFTEYDLSEAGVNGDEAVRLGLLSKFTAQRLHPIYKFFHPLFQEFLAGRRLSELLVSDEKEKLDRGLQYLQQVNTFRKVAGRYNFLLDYTCSFSSKAVPQVISHLFKLTDCKASLESQSENYEHLQHHADLLERMLFVDHISFLDPKLLLSVFIQHVLDFAISVVYGSNTVSVCAPIIFQFLRGKDISLTSFSPLKECELRFFRDYPESLSLPSSFQVSVRGIDHKQEFMMSEIGACYSSLGRPILDRDYAPAFPCFNDVAQKQKEGEEEIHRFLSLRQRHLPDSTVRPFLLTTRKMPLLKCTFSHISSFQEADLRNLMTLFSVADCIELELNNSPGFIEVIRPAIEQYKELFKKCSLHHLNLSIIEQELLLSMPFVECLEINEKEIPELLFSNLDKFICLEELSVSQCKNGNVFDRVPDGFKNLRNVKKLLMSRMKFENDSRLVECIKNFEDLSVFHLDCSSYLNPEPLLEAISSCKKLIELKLTGSFLGDRDLLSLAAALPNFVSLRVLDLASQRFEDKEACEIFAYNLGVLLNLEELIIPAGKGITSAAKLIVQQCLHLLHLRCFSFALHMDDDSLLEIAKVANCGGFQKLENLSLSVNHSVTETGWRNFFKTLNNMPALKKLDISRLFTHQIKASAPTVTAFVQCVSRLPGLVTIQMLGWLLDAEDLQMFDIMKEQHPQSRSLKLSWQWILPVSPIFQD